ncbi:hypothetical protein evm_005167 [Chilo suppressalis]|nr:hypothetical protein evm_005167 [Chilo suppressalis]
MSRISVVVLSLCLVLAIEYVNPSVITTKDVKVGDTTTSEIAQAQDEESKDKVEDVPVEVPPKATNEKEERKCAAVAEYCVNHSDCCSNLCLSFKRRCVSGTG